MDELDIKKIEINTCAFGFEVIVKRKSGKESFLRVLQTDGIQIDLTRIIQSIIDLVK